MPKPLPPTSQRSQLHPHQSHRTAMRITRPARRVLLLFPHPRDQRRATARRHAARLHGPARRLRIHPAFDHARSRRPDQRHARPNPRPADHSSPAHRRQERKKRPLRRRALPKPSEQTMVREVPDYARQYLIEHPEFGPPIEPACGAGTLAREAAPSTGPDAAAQRAAEAAAAKGLAGKRNARTSREAATERSPRRKPWDRTRKQSSSEGAKEPSRSILGRHRGLKEYELIKQAQAAIPGAMAGNWRDLRTVFEFAGIAEQNKEAPS